ncbi:MAG: hypothetical protein K2H90_03380 [Oscillospiraceae bacterium]|nr:hypothetical protein [Oscillospiraceae bacterium]
MEKIKKSFTKAFLPIFIASAALVILSKISDFAERFMQTNMPFSIRFQMFIKPINVYSIVFSLITIIMVSPFYIGLYDFLFCRVSGKKTRISYIFKFYRSPVKLFKSVAVRYIDMIFIIILLVFYTFIESLSLGGGGTIAVILMLIITAGICILLQPAPYVYAKNPENRLSDIVTGSFRLGGKYFYIFLVSDIIIIALSAVYLFLMPINNSYSGTLEDYNAVFGNSSNIITVIFSWLLNTVNMWIGFTAVYIIFEKEDKHMLKDFFNRKSNDDDEEEAPFIEPYDFFIEADERFSDEKVVETEDIRSVDILAVLDEMNLADDVKIDLAIRKKLKKIFEEISFEIGEYVTYNGGRSIENSFTEEIDEQEFEVSAEITRNSDYEPFKLTLRVNVLKED